MFILNYHSVFKDDTFNKNDNRKNRKYNERIKRKERRRRKADSLYEDCGKISYDNKDEAIKAAVALYKKSEEVFAFLYKSYSCPKCGKWHLTTIGMVKDGILWDFEGKTKEFKDESKYSVGIIK